MRVKPAGKIIAFLIVLGIVVGGYRFYVSRGGTNFLGNMIPGQKTKVSDVPLRVDPPTVTASEASKTLPTNKMPETTPANSSQPQIRMLLWAWNAQMGLMFANGGPDTTVDSLMADKQVNLHLERQDDSSKMAEALVAFATELSQGTAQPQKGAHFVCIMGDGSATFLKGLNDTLRKLGPEYMAKVIGSAGYSRGEDKLMGPQEWKDDPHKSMGGLVAGVIRDGDWNIAQKWLGDNGLKNNPDEKTWDPDAMNWVAANDYIDAGEKYITGYSEDRPVVKNGKKTGETKHVTVQGVVTWTPGDVNVATRKGGLVSIVSTKEYSGQMPNVIIGIDKWMKDNKAEVEAMLQAMCDGGDMVKSSSGALDAAGAVSAKVYKEQDKDYWVKYYKGVTQGDKIGLQVDLGGSSVNNLADNLLLFGMVPGSTSVFNATYKAFGDIVVAQYPDLLPRYYPVDQILDTSYLDDVRTRAPAVTIVKPTAPPGHPMGTPLSTKSWNIPFDTGKSSFTGAAVSQLEKLKGDLLIAGNTVVEIHGHTDSKGSASANQQLSEDRAFAVKNWLEKKDPVHFPQGRIRVFAHGASNPIASNSTAEGQARNRRVEIKIGIVK